MKILMFGWEFPPNNHGGLGTACYGLTKGFARGGHEVIVVLPSMIKEADETYVKVMRPHGIIKIDSMIQPYMTFKDYAERRRSYGKEALMYGENLIGEVERYAREACETVRDLDFDVIHAHDWLTFKAGIAAKKVTGKPLVVHVHATEYDRSGGHSANEYVYNIEKEGMEYADSVIAVSNYTKNIIKEKYNIDESKIKVVHNGVMQRSACSTQINITNKVVLFLGRLTMQKGPDYFLKAAKKVIDYDRNYTFVIAGSGDMECDLIEEASRLGICEKVLFTGFLKGDDVDKIYSLADLYVMPSVSEPFGITPLEAIRNGTPCIISKQSGVSEVLQHCLKCDFWDVDKMVNQILSIMKYKEGYNSIKLDAMEEIKNLNWENSSQKCIEIFKQLGGAI